MAADAQAENDKQQPIRIAAGTLGAGLPLRDLWVLRQHQVIFAEGAPSESLLLGPEAWRMLPIEAREEIELLFPKAAQRASLARPARVIPERRWQKTLVAESKAVALLPHGFKHGFG